MRDRRGLYDAGDTLHSELRERIGRGYMHDYGRPAMTREHSSPGRPVLLGIMTMALLAAVATAGYFGGTLAGMERCFAPLAPVLEPLVKGDEAE